MRAARCIRFEMGEEISIRIKELEGQLERADILLPVSYEMQSLIYTNNAIEGFNRQMRKVTKTRTVFPTDDSLFKLLFLAMRDTTAKWYGKPRNWGLIISQLMISFPGRISDEDFA